VEFGNGPGVHLRSQTRKAVRTIQNTEAAYKFGLQNAEVIPDVDRDGKPELLSGTWTASVTRDGRTISNAGRAIVRSLETGEVLYELNDPEPKAESGFSLALKGVGDVTGDGIGDIAIGAPWKSNYGRIYLFSGADGRWLRTLRSPNLIPQSGFGDRIEVLPDLNGDGVPELWTQGNPTSLFDGATSALLKTIESPGQRFYIGTVRQTAAPEIRAYLSIRLGVRGQVQRWRRLLHALHADSQAHAIKGDGKEWQWLRTEIDR